MASNSILNIKVNGEWVEVPCLKGEPGNDGTTPNLTIGTVEALASGSEATATITGDKENPVLNLGIPKGADGQGGSGEGGISYDDMKSYVDLQIGGAIDGSY